MKKTHLINAALVVGSVLFSAVLCEGYLRLATPHWMTAKLPFPPNINARFETNEFKTRVITNNIGLRDHREFTPLHDGTYRIAAIGDSFTFGWGVNNKEAFPAVLEEKLKAQSGNKLEIINFGRPGENPLGYLRTFNAHAKRLRPDMVLMGLQPANDCPLTPSLQTGTDEQARQRAAQLIRESSKPEKTPSSYVAWLMKTRVTQPVRNWLRNSMSKGTPNTVHTRDPINGSKNPLDPAELEKTIGENTQQWARYKTLKESEWVARGERRDVSPWLIVSAILNPDSISHALLLEPQVRKAMEHQWQICEQAIKAFSQIVEATGAKFVMMVLATPAQVSPEFLAARRHLGMDTPDTALTDTAVNDRIKAFCDREGLTCVDTLSAARQASANGADLFFPIDGHPTRAGQALYAEIAARKLLEQLPER